MSAHCSLPHGACLVMEVGSRAGKCGDHRGWCNGRSSDAAVIIGAHDGTSAISARLCSHRWQGCSFVTFRYGVAATRRSPVRAPEQDERI
ncbi:hypothetical protein T261_5277 [Streptomyces lydicus]|nr:hypothetical protein T261_5277 [Streptomyces lydicus]